MPPSPTPSISATAGSLQRQIFAAQDPLLQQSLDSSQSLLFSAQPIPAWTHIAAEIVRSITPPSSYRLLTFDEMEANAVEAARPASKAARQWEQPQALPGRGPWMAGKLVTQTIHVDFYVGRSTFSAKVVEWIARDTERALAEAEARFGTGLSARTSVAFYRPALAGIPGVRGLAFSDRRQIEVYYRPYEDPERAVAIVIHELGHQLEADRYGNAVQRRADTILHEGLATWLAGKRWLTMRGADSWRQRGRQLQISGRLLPLLRDPPGEAANDAYDGWASFVDYLISTYGWQAFDDLYRSSRGRYTGSAKYGLVYGRSLDQLADDWRAWLKQ